MTISPAIAPTGILHTSRIIPPNTADNEHTPTYTTSFSNRATNPSRSISGARPTTNPTY